MTLLLIAAILQAPEPREVQVESAFVYPGPSRLFPPLRRLRKGQLLRALPAGEGWAAVVIAGRTGYVRESIFLPRLEFTDWVGQGQESVRGETCWPSIEMEIFESIDRPLAAAYRETDLLQFRSARAGRLGYLDERLAAFRREGRLGEFAAQERTVETPLAYVFARPDRTSDIVLKVKQGTRLRRVGEEGKWTRVELDDGRRGWVLSIAFTPPSDREERVAEPGHPAPEVEREYRPSPGAIRADVAGMLARGRIDDALRRLRAARDAGVFGPR